MNKLLQQRDCVFLILDLLGIRDLISFKRVCQKFRRVLTHYLKNRIGNIDYIEKISKIADIRNLEFCFKKSMEDDIQCVIEIYYKEIDIRVYVYLSRNLSQKISFEEKNVVEKMNSREKIETLDIIEKSKSQLFFNILPNYKFCNAKFV